MKPKYLAIHIIMYIVYNTKKAMEFYTFFDVGKTKTIKVIQASVCVFNFVISF